MPTGSTWPAPSPQPSPARRRGGAWIVIAAGIAGFLLGISVASSGHSPSSPTTTAAPATKVAGAQAGAAPVAAVAPASASQFGPGTYEVGTASDQIQPGKYKSTGPDGSNSAGCYYSRLRHNDGSIDDILSNDVSQGPSVFTVKPTDGFVNIVGCSFTKA